MSSIKEQLAKVEAQYAELGVQLKRLQEQAEQEAKEPNWSQMVGRFVMVRNHDTENWTGPYQLKKYNGYAEFSFYVTSGMYWQECRYCKLYDGPTVPNWIEHTGDNYPFESSTNVLVKYRNGQMDVSSSDRVRWINVSDEHPNKEEEYRFDVVAYTELKDI